MTTHFVAISIILTYIAVCWALWVRRGTWGLYWESAATATVAVSGVSMVLTSPWTSDLVGPKLFQLTGVNGLNQWLGQCFILGCNVTFILHMLKRTAILDEQMMRRVHQRLCAPFTFTTAIMLALLVQGDNKGKHLIAQTDSWLKAYWLVFCALVIYLQTYLGLVLLKLRTDRRSRRLATVYLVTIVAGIVGTVLRMGTVFYNAPDNETCMWLFTSFAVSVFSIGTGYSWLVKNRHQAAV